MNKLIFTLARLALIPLMLLLLYGAWQKLSSGSVHFNTDSRMWFLILFGGGMLVRFLFAYFSKQLKKSNPFHFIDTLEHELTHALFGYLTFTPPKSLWASHENEGEVILARHNVLIVLGPYFFPLWTFISLVTGFFIKSELQFIWHSITLVLLSFYIYRLLLEIRWYQTDLAIYGRVFSLLFVCMALILSLTVILHFTDFADGRWLAEVPLDVYQSVRDVLGEAAGYTSR